MDGQNPFLVKSNMAYGTQNWKWLNRDNSATNCLMLLKFGSWVQYASKEAEELLKCHSWEIQDGGQHPEWKLLYFCHSPWLFGGGSQSKAISKLALHTASWLRCCWVNNINHMTIVKMLAVAAAWSVSKMSQRQGSECMAALFLQHSYGIEHGRDYKTSLRLSVNLGICLCALLRSHFLTDFHQNWHRLKNPQK